MFVEQSTQEFGVLLVFFTVDHPDTVQRAYGARIFLSTEHQHLVSVDLHSHVLQEKKDASVIFFKERKKE